MKKTWAFGYAREDDIKIEEVLQTNDLELAVLSSFQLDADWVMSKINISKTKLIWVLQAKTEAEVRVTICLHLKKSPINYTLHSV